MGKNPAEDQEGRESWSVTEHPTRLKGQLKYSY